MNILITGASSGIGRELALRYSTPGNNLLLSGRNKDRLADVLVSGMPTLVDVNTPAYGYNSCVAVDTDLAHGSTQQALISRVEKNFSGKLDLLILSAGVYAKGDPFVDDLSDIDILEGTLCGNLALCISMLPFLKSAGGQIVHMNSIAGKNLSPGEAIYSAAKHAMTGFLRSLRLDARNHNVRVMDVFLGGVQTPMTANRPGADKLMSMHAVATVIKSNIDLNQMQTLQIEELQLGRTIF